MYYGPSPRGPLVAYADLATGLFTREGAQRYRVPPGDLSCRTRPPNASPARSTKRRGGVSCPRETRVASERQLRRLGSRRPA